MKLVAQVLTTLVLTIGVALPVSAQVTRADTAQVIYNVAEDLMREGRETDAERLYVIIRDRYGDTQFAALAAQALEGVVNARATHSGRTELVAWSTFYGAALGLMIPAALSANDAEPYGLGLLLGGPAGFGLSRAWSAQNPVSSGQARAMTFGSWWGTFQGIGWQQALDLGDRTRTECFDAGNGIECFEFRTESDEAPFTAMVLGGLTGMAVGTAIGRARPISASSALITNFSAMWGSWFGTVAGVLADGDDDFNGFERNNDHSTLIASLVGGNIGLLAGAFGAPALNWTTGQAWSVHLAGVAGLVAGFGLDLLGSVDDTKGALVIPGITSALGLAIAAATIRDRDPSPPIGASLQMSLIDLQGGRLSLGIPTPVPTAIPVWRGGKRVFAAGARFTLVNLQM